MDDLPDEPLVSVVLCTYNPAMEEHFREAAESVLGQTYERVELVVVVDGSEALFERVKSVYGGREDVVLHANETNVGLLESRNTGAELASGEVVAFIDDDAVADERWVEELIAAYEEHAAIAVGGRMTPRWVAGKPAYLPEEFYWLVGVTHEGFADGPGEVRNTFGSNLSFRRDVFLAMDGFDTEVGGRKGAANLQAGETELCARMRAEYGKGVWYTPDALVGHKVFEYRTRFRWICSRAFWQGFSKRTMQQSSFDGTREERDFLYRLVTEFFPSRLKQLIVRPSSTRIMKNVVLLLLTVIVGVGFSCGLLNEMKNRLVRS